MSMRRALLVLPLLVSASLSAQDIAGRWRTVDENTGEKKSVVEITVLNGIASGRVVEIVDKTRAGRLCTACTDDRKGQPLQGLEIIRGMQEDDGEWSEGTILDPENGKIYDAKLWVEDGKLQVRGYIGFFFRTQEWVR